MGATSNPGSREVLKLLFSLSWNVVLPHKELGTILLKKETTWDRGNLSLLRSSKMVSLDQATR